MSSDVCIGTYTYVQVFVCMQAMDLSSTPATHLEAPLKPLELVGAGRAAASVPAQTLQQKLALQGWSGVGWGGVGWGG